MTAIWAGERGIGPAPYRGTRPQLLIGGTKPKSFERVAKYADGWTMGGGGPAMRPRLPAVRETWTAAGRAGSPRIVVLCYFALGDDAEEQAARTLGDYYGFAGPYAQRIIDGARDRRHRSSGPTSPASRRPVPTRSSSSRPPPIRRRSTCWRGWCSADSLGELRCQGLPRRLTSRDTDRTQAFMMAFTHLAYAFSRSPPRQFHRCARHSCVFDSSGH